MDNQNYFKSFIEKIKELSEDFSEELIEKLEDLGELTAELFDKILPFAKETDDGLHEKGFTIEHIQQTNTLFLAKALGENQVKNIQPLEDWHKSFAHFEGLDNAKISKFQGFYNDFLKEKEDNPISIKDNLEKLNGVFPIKEDFLAAKKQFFAFQNIRNLDISFDIKTRLLQHPEYSHSAAIANKPILQYEADMEALGIKKEERDLLRFFSLERLGQMNNVVINYADLLANSVSPFAGYFNDLKEMDSYADWFGSQNYCECEHCRSILSPAAYFVDLMYFVEKHIPDKLFKDTNGLVEDPNNSLKLKNRRSDLWTLDLNCENTNKRIPYLQIVNKVLGTYIKETPLTGYKDAYKEKNEYHFLQQLDRSRETPLLPYNLPYNTLRAYLQKSDINWEQLLRDTLRSQEEITAIQLGLSPEEYELIVRGYDEFVTQAEGYDGPENNIVSAVIAPIEPSVLVDYFLIRTGLDRKELDVWKTVGLLDTKFNDGVKDYNVKIVELKTIKDPSDIQKFNEIVYIYNDVNVSEKMRKILFDGFLRHIQIWRKTGLTIGEYEIMLQSLNENYPMIWKEFEVPNNKYKAATSRDFNQARLNAIANFLHIKEKLNLSVEETATILHLFPTIILKDNTQNFWLRSFNSTVLNSEFSALFNSTDVKETTADKKEKYLKLLPHLCRGLGVSASDLELLLAHLLEQLPKIASDANIYPKHYQAFKGTLVKKKEEFTLSNDTLSLLYRYTRLARALGVNMSVLVEMLKMSIKGLSLIETTDDIKALIALKDKIQFLGLNPLELRYIISTDVTNTGFKEVDNEKIKAAIIKVKAAKKYLLDKRIVAEGLDIDEGNTDKLIEKIEDYLNIDSYLLIIDKNDIEEKVERTKKAIEVAALPADVIAILIEKDNLKLLAAKLSQEQIFTNAFQKFEYTLNGKKEEISLEQSMSILAELKNKKAIAIYTFSIKNKASIEQIKIEGIDKLGNLKKAKKDIANSKITSVFLEEPCFSIAFDLLAETIGVSEEAFAQQLSITQYDRLQEYITFNDAEIKKLINLFARSKYFFEKASINAVELKFLYETSGITNLASLNVDDLVCIKQFKNFQKLHEDKSSIYLDAIRAFYNTNVSQEPLRLWLGLPESLYKSIRAEIFDDLYKANDNLFINKEISKPSLRVFSLFLQCLEVCVKLGINGKQLNDLIHIPVGKKESLVGAYLEYLKNTSKSAIENKALIDDFNEPTNSAALFYFDPTNNGANNVNNNFYGGYAKILKYGFSPIEKPFNQFTYEQFETLSAAIGAHIRMQYEKESDYDKAMEKINEQLNMQKRDALCNFLIAISYKEDGTTKKPFFGSYNRIYEHFLLDVARGGCSTISKIVEATNSIQLYVHRVLMHLEVSKGNKETMVEDFDTFKTEWEWRKNYRVWEANRKVFLYPENYLLPELRDNKTHLFKELEDDLLQQKITPEAAEMAYRKYLAGFVELCNLQYAGSCQDGKKKYIFAYSNTEPYQYYYRINTKTGNIKEYGNWIKVDLSIETKTVTPYMKDGRLYIFWLDVQHRELSSFDKGTPTQNGHVFKVYVKYAFLKENKKWSTVQKAYMNDFEILNEQLGAYTDVNKDTIIKNFINTNFNPLLIGKKENDGSIYVSLQVNHSIKVEKEKTLISAEIPEREINIRIICPKGENNPILVRRKLPKFVITNFTNNSSIASYNINLPEYKYNLLSILNPKMKKLADALDDENLQPPDEQKGMYKIDIEYYLSFGRYNFGRTYWERNLRKDNEFDPYKISIESIDGMSLFERVNFYDFQNVFKDYKRHVLNEPTSYNYELNEMFNTLEEINDNAIVFETSNSEKLTEVDFASQLNTIYTGGIDKFLSLEEQVQCIILV